MNSNCRYTVQSGLLAWLVASGLVAMSALQPAAGQPGAATEVMPGAPASWQPYDLQFHYSGFNTYYSCSGLEDRLEQILRQLGADRDMRVTASGCFGWNDVSNMLRVRIRARLPVAPGSADAQSFMTVSKLITLQTRRLGDIGSGDCELLEQVRNQLLPAFKMQLVKDELHCTPGQMNLGTPSLQVMVLIPAPAAQP